MNDTPQEHQLVLAQHVSDEFMDGKKVKSVTFPKPLEAVITFIDNSRCTTNGLIASKLRRH